MRNLQVAVPNRASNPIATTPQTTIKIIFQNAMSKPIARRPASPSPESDEPDVDHVEEGLDPPHPNEAEGDDE
jgi:hypothetical protein